MFVLVLLFITWASAQNWGYDYHPKGNYLGMPWPHDIIGILIL
jgi:hypothetical protein